MNELSPRTPSEAKEELKWRRYDIEKFRAGGAFSGPMQLDGGSAEAKTPVARSTKNKEPVEPVRGSCRR